MAWIALVFYWLDSINQWLTSDLTSWPRGEGGGVLINLFCVHGFEIHHCRLVFKNTWTEFGKHKINIYLIFIINHQKISQITKIWWKNRHAKHWSSYKQKSQATKRWKFQVLSWKNWMANVIRFAIKTIQGTDFWKTWGNFYDRVFPQTTTVSQRKQYKVRFSLIFVSHRLIKKISTSLVLSLAC